MLIDHNFVKIHKTINTTPAMEAEVTDFLWSIEGIVMMGTMGQSKVRLAGLAQPHILSTTFSTIVPRASCAVVGNSLAWLGDVTLRIAITSTVGTVNNATRTATIMCRIDESILG